MLQPCAPEIFDGAADAKAIVPDYLYALHPARMARVVRGMIHWVILCLWTWNDRCFKFCHYNRLLSYTNQPTLSGGLCFFGDKILYSISNARATARRNMMSAHLHPSPKPIIAHSSPLIAPSPPAKCSYYMFDNINRTFLQLQSCAVAKLSLPLPPLQQKTHR